MKRALLDFLGLFSSISSIFCCALPAIFVAIGFGATFVSLINLFPQLIWFSENKNVVFMFGGAMLLINWPLVMKTSTTSCTVNMAGSGDYAKSSNNICEESKKRSKIIYFISLIFYAIGLSFAFILPIINKY
jgi:hypothetical protein